MKGIVFDIQRNALHDGRGIRTVVFLKGCPFRCVWCCNPESQRLKPELAHLEEYCKHCAKCVGVCEHGALSVVGGRIAINFRKCKSCGKCVTACAYSAMKIYGQYLEADDVIADVMKDKEYFDASGGGLTLSGGDPLLQTDYACELLRKAKEKGLHTTVETEGYYSGKVFGRVLPYVDYLYFDYKITDEEDHRKYALAQRSMVMKSLEYVTNYGVKMCIRCVIIPDLNDNDEHFLKIAEISTRYPNVEAVEIMPYHDFGNKKYYTLGRNPYIVKGGSVKREVAERWVEKIVSMGGKNIRIG